MLLFVFSENNTSFKVFVFRSENTWEIKKIQPGYVARKEEKDDFGEEVKFLGLNVSGGRGPVKISLPEEKRVAYLDSLRGFLSTGACCPSDAESMAGRLNFATTYLWGRAPRIFMVPFYIQSKGASSLIGNRLKSAILWWIQFLGRPKARFMIRPSKKVDAIVHTDASLSGLGVMVKLAHGPPSYYSARAPEGFL